MVILWLVFGPMAGAALAALAGTCRRFPAGIRRMAADGGFAVLVSLAVLPAALDVCVRQPRASIEGILAGGVYFTADGFRGAYALLTVFMWLMTALFSLEYFRHEPAHLPRYWFFNLVTLGAVEGVMLSADLMTAFLFFEILSFTSFVWVIHEQTPEAVRAGQTYLAVAVTGGLILLMGLFLLQHAAGTLSFARLRQMAEAGPGSTQLLAGGVCILAGFGAKAGMFPLHIWLPRAHPAAPSPASALLSGILTKVGIYGILMSACCILPASLPYGEILLAAGAVTMLLGAILGVFSTGLKRTLACSSMSQIGFILTGIGMTVLLRFAGEEEGAWAAIGGVMLHMVSHSLIKLVLFMAAGAAVMGLHAQDLDTLRGWGRNKPFLKAAFALGALSISGIPGGSGFVSKTLLHEGITEGIRACAAGLPAALAAPLHLLEGVFLFAGGLTFAYMLKLFICIFCEKNTDPHRQEQYGRTPHCMNPCSTAVILGPALLLPVLGQGSPARHLAAWMAGSPLAGTFRPFTAESLEGAAISLFIGALVYLLFVRKVLLREGRYRDLWPAGLDLENRIYRPLLLQVLPSLLGGLAAVFGRNRLLVPLCRGTLRAAAVLARCFADSFDGLIWLLRRTILAEKQSREPEKMRGKRLRTATTENLSTVLDGFSFALMMTCMGIVVILGVILWMTVLR